MFEGGDAEGNSSIVSLSVFVVVFRSYTIVHRSLFIQLHEVPWVVRISGVPTLVNLPRRANLSSALLIGLIGFSVCKCEVRQRSGRWLRLSYIILYDQIILSAAQEHLICLAYHL